jgi:hypothetical protein
MFGERYRAATVRESVPFLPFSQTLTLAVPNARSLFGECYRTATVRESVLCRFLHRFQARIPCLSPFLPALSTYTAAPRTTALTRTESAATSKP